MHFFNNEIDQFQWRTGRHTTKKYRLIQASSLVKYTQSTKVFNSRYTFFPYQIIDSPLRLPPDDTATVVAAALALLPLGGVEQREVVVVGELLARVYVTQREQRHAELPVHRPLLHLAVGTARVVDEAAVAAHPVPVDHEPAVQVEAVVVGIVDVPVVGI